MKVVTTLSSLALIVALAACGGSSSGSATAPAGSGPGGGAGAGGAAGTSSTTPLFPAGTPAGGPTAGPLPDSFPKFKPQEGWVEEAPANGMRLKQYSLPGDDTAGPALLVISYWRGGIGPMEPNLDRWVSQVGVETPANELTAEQRWTAEPSGFLVTGMHVEGAIQTTEGMATDIKSTGQDAILAAFIERPGVADVWTAKITGPAATVSRHRKAFEAMIAGL